MVFADIRRERSSVWIHICRESINNLSCPIIYSIHGVGHNFSLRWELTIYRVADRMSTLFWISKVSWKLLTYRNISLIENNITHVLTCSDTSRCQFVSQYWEVREYVVTSCCRMYLNTHWSKLTVYQNNAAVNIQWNRPIIIVNLIHSACIGVIQLDALHVRVRVLE